MMEPNQKEKLLMPAKPKSPKLKPRDTRQHPSIVGALLGLATLVGVPAAVVAFWPRVTVTASDPVDPTQPFSSSMTITNGLLPLDSVYPSIAVGDVGFMMNGKAIHIKSTNPYGAVLGHDWPQRDMGIDEKVTFALNDLPLPPFYADQKELIDAKIAVVVNYKLPIVHVKLQKRFYFFARRQTNGNFYWYSDSNPK
jgi:hypothetical protein